MGGGRLRRRSTLDTDPSPATAGRRHKRSWVVTTWQTIADQQSAINRSGTIFFLCINKSMFATYFCAGSGRKYDVYI